MKESWALRRCQTISNTTCMPCIRFMWQSIPTKEHKDPQLLGFRFYRMIMLVYNIAYHFKQERFKGKFYLDGIMNWHHHLNLKSGCWECPQFRTCGQTGQTLCSQSSRPHLCPSSGSSPPQTGLPPRCPSAGRDLWLCAFPTGWSSRQHPAITMISNPQIQWSASCKYNDQHPANTMISILQIQWSTSYKYNDQNPANTMINILQIQYNGQILQLKWSAFCN